MSEIHMVVAVSISSYDNDGDMLVRNGVVFMTEDDDPTENDPPFRWVTFRYDDKITFRLRRDEFDRMYQAITPRPVEDQ